MNWEKFLLWGAVAVVLALGVLVIGNAKAADLGGSCCADLEERIAELEATTARKGNRKVSVTVYGQVSQALINYDIGSENDAFVTENSAAETFLGARGEAVIQPRLTAGFVLEVGLGGFETGLNIPGTNTHEVYTRQANVWLEGKSDGLKARGTIGLQSQATDGIAELTTANTAVVARLGSLRPINGPLYGEVVDLFDGTRTNAVRGDLSINGFTASASWSDEDIWDAALTFKGEGLGFLVQAGIGYRDGVVAPGLGVIPQVEVISGSASIKHIETGIFVSGMAGRAEVDEAGVKADAEAWHAQAGLERKFLTALGATTVFGEYGELESGALTIWGGGIVQAFDSAAIDIYLNVRKLEFELDDEDEDATVSMVGARIRF